MKRCKLDCFVTLFLAMTILALALIASCTQSTTTKLQTEAELRAAIVAQCNTAEKQQTEECTSKCATFGDLGWCVSEKYSCPTDGSYKGVNPFTGEEVALPVSPAKVEDPALSDSSSVATISDGNFNTQIVAQGSTVKFGDGIVETLSLGSPIVSVTTYKDTNGGYNLLAGTESGLAVIPFSYDTATQIISITKEAIKIFDKLGGIKQVLVKASPDISKKVPATNVDPGIMMSVGTATAKATSSLDFVYMLTASGDVWRVKFINLNAGGCLERIYAATDTEKADRISVAGQYIAKSGSDKLSVVNLFSNKTGDFHELASGKKVTDVMLASSEGYLVFAPEINDSQVTVLTSNLENANKTAYEYATKSTETMTDAKITDDGKNIYVRGTDRYLAIVPIADPTAAVVIPKEKLLDGDPKDIIYDAATDEIITTFKNNTTIERLSRTSL